MFDFSSIAAIKLQYRSKRRGFQNYVKGQIRAIAKQLYGLPLTIRCGHYRFFHKNVSRTIRGNIWMIVKLQLQKLQKQLQNTEVGGQTYRTLGWKSQRSSLTQWSVHTTWILTTGKGASIYYVYTKGVGQCGANYLNLKLTTREVGGGKNRVKSSRCFHGKKLKIQ